MGYIALGDLISKAQVEKCGKREYPVLSMTMHDGIVFQNDRFKKDIASVDRSNYSIVGFNQLVVSFPIDEGVLAVQDITDAGIVSPAYKIWDIDQAKLVPKYLEMWLRSPRSIDYYKSKLRGTTARRRSIPEEDFLGMRVNVPPMEEQERIVDLITRVKGVMLLREQELVALGDLIKARFVEMFGDPLLNPMNWKEEKLEEIADIVSGITKGRKLQSTDLYEVPYMAVSNVKDGYIDWTTVKTILASQAEIDQYRLLPNDVLMTEGGDPDKLGRGAIIHEPPSDCIHQNHIFRVRLDQSRITPEFMGQYLQHQKAKRYFLGCAKQTTGIASINMKQLRALPMLMPPIGLQREFAAFVAQIDKSKSVIQKSLDETQLLFDSLMQEYFG